MDVNDWALYKKLRLASLIDSPDAFSSTWERESQFSDQEWQRRISTATRENHYLPLVALCNGEACGLAAGLADEADTRKLHVFQMWVHPDYRGKGIGRTLLDEIILWAKNSGKFDSLLLGVNVTNENAIQLYLSAGFIIEGEPEPLRPGSQLKLQNMVLSVG